MSSSPAELGGQHLQPGVPSYLHCIKNQDLTPRYSMTTGMSSLTLVSLIPRL